MRPGAMPVMPGQRVEGADGRLGSVAAITLKNPAPADSSDSTCPSRRMQASSPSGFVSLPHAQLIAVIYIGFVALAQSDPLTHHRLLLFHAWDSVVAGLSFRTRRTQAVRAGWWTEGFRAASLPPPYPCAWSVLCDRVHSREISAWRRKGHVINAMPRICVLSPCCSSAWPTRPRRPPGFQGEFMVIHGAIRCELLVRIRCRDLDFWRGLYLVWMVKRVVFGDIANDNVRAR